MTPKGRLLARPSATGRPGSSPVTAPGEQTLGLGGRRDGLLYVPAGCQAAANPPRPAPLVVLLHGAGGGAGHGLDLLRGVADQHGLVLLAPDSRAPTWDVIAGEYGPDVDFLDRALAHTFARCAIDPARLALGGFSDGGSYALSLGITNGDLFTHLIALSPGFLAPAARRGAPRIFVSHGTHDRVLPIDRCSRRIVPSLERAGYDVRYHEFDGPHTVPPPITREAAHWFVAGRNTTEETQQQ